MVDSTNYPQLPKAAYWALRKFLNKRPSIALDSQIVAAEINVQATAAKQYIVEMQRLGIVDADGKLTTLGNDWRIDDTYRTATDRIMNNCYSEGLVAIASPGEAERQKVVSWFVREGLGTGSAGNKAATYLMLANDSILSGPELASQKANTGSKPKVTRPKPDANTSQSSRTSAPTVNLEAEKQRQPTPNNSSIPLNINLQIHISADASAEQINLVFESMKRHLYGS